MCPSKKAFVKNAFLRYDLLFYVGFYLERTVQFSQK